MAKEKSLSESLRYIYEHKGIDAFLNEKVMYSMLSDLTPKNSKEINWVIDAINIGAIKPLLEAEKNNLNKEEQKKKARKIFEDNEISESRINYLLDSFFYGLKWNDKIVSFEDIKKNEQNVKQKITNSNNNNTKNNNEKINQQKKDNTKLKRDNSNLKNTKVNNTKKQTVNQRNTQSNNKNRLTQDKLKSLEVEYNALYTGLDRSIQSNGNYVGSLSMINIFIRGAINVVSFLICLSIMISYLIILKEGYIYKRILILDIVGFVLGIKLMTNNFNNLKKIKADLSAKKIYKEYINLKNNVHADKEKFMLGLVSSINSYNGLNNRLKLYKNEYIDINNKWKNTLNSTKHKDTKISKLLILFYIIFIISGIYESRLIYDKDNTITEVSKPIVESVVSKLNEKQRACVKVDSANIRRLANKESEIIGNFKKYDILDLTGRSYENNDEGIVWYEIDSIIYGKGWISESVVKLVPKKVTVFSSSANIRNKPSLNSSSVHIVNAGDTLYTTGYAVVTSERTWYEVYINEEKGYWISSKVLQND